MTHIHYKDTPLTNQQRIRETKKDRLQNSFRTKFQLNLQFRKQKQLQKKECILLDKKMILIKFLNYFKTDIFRQSNKRIIQNRTTQHKNGMF